MYLGTTGEHEVLINLDRVDAIIHNEEDNTILFKFAYRTESIEYSEESWNTIVDVLHKAEKDNRITFPKPLDVKVVNK